MTVKKLAVALLATLALAAVIASTAAAHPALETNGFWYKNGTKIAAGVKEPITCTNTGNFVLEGHTVDILGTLPFKAQATGLSCPGGKIFNQSSKAGMIGSLRFTGVTGIEPPCEISHGVIQTEAIKGQVWMQESTAKALLRIAPASGTLLAEIGIGNGCALNELHPLKGVIFAEFTNVTFTSALTQPLLFSGPINATAGGALTLDGDPATLTGAAGISLTSGGTLAVNES